MSGCPRINGVVRHMWVWTVPLAPWRRAHYRCICGARK